jgi:uncharacterized protein (DUF1800 family)
MVTRRAFHQSLISLALLAGLPRPAQAAETSNPDERILNRLTFGATTDTRREFAQLGLDKWLDNQLATEAGDLELDRMLGAARLRIAYVAGDDGEGRSWEATDELRPLTMLTADPAELVALLDYSVGKDYSERTRPAQEVIAASLIRAVNAKAQLREVITQFWHDHFSVNALKSEMTAAFFPSHDALLRRHALGNFRVLLGEVARSPAMLYYLNNEDSKASPANENFARELLELHTLGAANYLNDEAPDWKDVPGALEGQAAGYIDQDVYEVARAFTGWTVGDGRWLAEGMEAPRTGRFHFAEVWHDPYQKRILGIEFPPNRAPLADGEQVLDILAGHPGTAERICTKLIRRLLTDDPDPGMVIRISDVFKASATAPDQIALVVRAIVADPLFSETPPVKIRRPFEFLAALYRATGAVVRAPEAAFDWQLSLAGWHQHSYGPPTGHPDRFSRWSGPSTMNRLVDFALYAHDDWFGCTATSLAEMSPQGSVNFDDMAHHWTSRLLGPAVKDRLPELASFLGIADTKAVTELSPEDRQGLAVASVAFAALTPQFLMR